MAGRSVSKTSTKKQSKAVAKPVLLKMTEELWIEMRALYESGNYSQQNLSDWAKAKGYSCSQPSIGRRIDSESWVKGHILESVREEVLKQHRETMGEKLVDMLQQHTQMTQMAMKETLRHFKVAAEKQQVDPDYLIPAAQLAMLTTTLKTQHDMQARSMGWNYKEGKPFSGDEEDNEVEVPTLKIEVMSEEEEAEIRQRGQDNLDAMNE